MAFVQIIDVAVVLDARVPALLAVDVVVVGVRLMAHEESSASRMGTWVVVSHGSEILETHTDSAPSGESSRQASLTPYNLFYIVHSRGETKKGSVLLC